MHIRVSQVWLLTGAWLVIDAGRHLLGLGREPSSLTIAADVTLAIFTAALTVIGVANRIAEKRPA